MHKRHQTNIELGRWGEHQAACYLEDEGYEVLQKNVRTPCGEIDLIARKAGVLVFIEVKTRSSSVYGHPEEAVDQNKISHMIDSAESFLEENPACAQDWRLDVIAVIRDPAGDPQITHFENAVQA